MITALIGVVYWLQSAKSHQYPIWVVRSKQWQSGSQINLYIQPNWGVGVDLVNDQLTFFQFDAEVGIGELAITGSRAQVWFDGYLGATESTTLNASDIKSLVSRAIYSSSVPTSLSPLQLIELWWGIKADATTKKMVSPTFPEAQVLEEGLSVAVFNGTRVSGLASETSHWVENIGGRVVDVGNGDREFTKTRIEVHWAPDNSRTVARLEQIFGTKAVPVPYESRQRADIDIYAGNDRYQ